MKRLQYLVIPVSFAAACGLLADACSGSSFNSGSAEGGTGTASGGSSTSSGGSSTSSGGSSTSSGGSSTSSGGSSTSSGGSSSSAGSTSTGGTSSGGTSSAAGSGGAPAGGSVGAAGAGGTDCVTLRADADKALTAAQVCDPSLNTAQCTGSVHGVCGCTVPTRPNDSDVTKAYLAALKAVQDNNCVGLCPAIACIAPGPGACVANAMGKLGTCESTGITAQ